REIVRKFNNVYGDVLKEPESVLSSRKRIKGLDGNDKMGKSLGNAVYLVDDLDTITKKIMNAVTPGRCRGRPFSRRGGGCGRGSSGR
ncbi:MAG: hypothetical protein IJJ23_09410, partial [Clostridia bacterium]|nr:hypothetical protein [Clostridia bacterium]